MSDAHDINPDDPNSDDPGGDDLLAAEVSLGLLTGDAAAQAARRARIDPAFAALVRDWDVRFSQMTDEIAPVTPPKSLWRKITSDAYPDSPKRLWQQLGVIPALLGSAAAALVLILALQFGALMQPNGPTPSLVAQMASADSSIVVAAAYLEDEANLVVEWQVGTRLPDRDVELWLVVEGEAPVSLGVLMKGGKITEFTIPAPLRDQLAGAALAVSDEPLGGSTTGAPSGDVLAAGRITTF